MPFGLFVDNEAGAGELDPVCLGKRGDDGSHVDFEQREELAIGDVSGGNQEEPRGAAEEQVGIEEIGVLGDDDGVLAVGHCGDVVIGGAVTAGEIEGVAGGMTEFGKADGQQARKLGIHEEIHAAGSAWKRLILVRRAA